MSEPEQNRSEPATPFKLADAKKDGQVARSLDFNSFVIVSSLIVVLLMSGKTVAGKLAGLCAALLLNAGQLRLESTGDVGWLGTLVGSTLDIVAPFAVAGVVFAVLANIVQIGPVFTFKPLQPKFERLNPVTGLRRAFSKRLLFDSIKTLVKLGLFVAVLYGFVRKLWPNLPQAAGADTPGQIAWLSSNATALLFRLVLVLLLAGVVDFAYVRWQFGKQMMMSRRELKEEVKRREGDPHVRAKIRELQRENLKQARSLGRVPDADVLITNPEHLAVALRYDRSEMSAPCVIAKGTDAWAADMRATARRHGIPILERRGLARLLFRRTQIDQPIPAGTFLEVARIYADIEAQRRSRSRYEVLQ